MKWRQGHPREGEALDPDIRNTGADFVKLLPPSPRPQEYRIPSRGR